MTTARPSTAMVLAAGRGQRMRPLSDTLPKPALPLPGGPLVAWAMRQAAAGGAHRLVVNSWHLAPLMEKAIEAADTGGLEVIVSREDRLMGTAGALSLARGRGVLGAGGPILVVNGDIVIDLDLAALLERHAHSGDHVTLGLLPHPDPAAWSQVALDSSGAIAAILPPGAPPTELEPFLYPGVMVVARAALEEIPEGPGDVNTLLWQRALRRRRLGGAVLSGSWREVGDPAAYLDAAIHMVKPATAVDPTAQVAADAVLAAAFVGPGARVESGAEVAESVAAAGAVVRHGARVTRCLLLGPIEIGPGEKITNQIRTVPAAPARGCPDE